MINIFIYLFYSLFLIFSSCQERSEKLDAAYAAMASYSKPLKKEKSWHLRAIGGSFYADVFKLDIGYSIYCQKYTVSEVRRMIVEGIEGLLTHTNKDERVRPYISNYPLTSQDINFSLLFLDEKRHFIHDGFITSASFLGKNIYYRTKKTDEPFEHFEEVHQETYEEALRIVNAEKLQQLTLVAEEHLASGE
jgi:hypothetical protein